MLAIYLDSTAAAAPAAEVGGVEDAAMAPDERSASSLSWGPFIKDVRKNFGTSEPPSPLSTF